MKVFTKEFTIAPQRSVRVEDELWEAAMARASREDDTLSQVIRRFLTDYVKKDDQHDQHDEAYVKKDVKKEDPTPVTPTPVT